MTPSMESWAPTMILRMGHSPRQLGTIYAFLTRRGLEQLERIAVRILDLNLLAARTHFHLVPKTHPLVPELSDTCGQVPYLQNHPVPSAGFLLAAIGHRPGA